jgi:adenine phosphoribosyltransferase
MPGPDILDSSVRRIPDFPKPGVLFYDITGVLANPAAFSYCIERMEELYAEVALDGVAAIESRGFVFGAPFARDRRLPLILLRKKGKLPGATWQTRFTLEYGEDVLEVHKSDVRPGMRLLLVDDLIATGGTLRASIELLSLGGAEVAAIFGVIGLPFLGYQETLAGHAVTTLIQFHGECA